MGSKLDRVDKDEIVRSLEELLQIVTVAMPAYLRAQDPRVIRAEALVARLKGELN